VLSDDLFFKSYKGFLKMYTDMTFKYSGEQKHVSLGCPSGEWEGDFMIGEEEDN
jgi:hypothetical protein